MAKIYPPLDPDFPFPPAGTVTCGLRADLPRKARVHAYHDAGHDVRHLFSGYFELRRVLICPRCGKDTDVPMAGAVPR